MVHLFTQLLFAIPLPSVPLLPADPVRDEYVQSAVAGSLGAKARRLGVAETREAIAIVRSQLMPSLNLEARASERYGAVIDLGALVNPAYAGLNQVIGQPVYPTNLDLALPLRRETKLSVTLPIFAPALWHQIDLRQGESEVAETNFKVFARQLRADVQRTYYLVGRTAQVIRVLDRTVELLEENLRTTQLLLSAGKVTQEAELRARVDLGDVRQNRIVATRGLAGARRFLNFLASRDLEAPVKEPTLGADFPHIHQQSSFGVDGREELAAVLAGRRVAESAKRIGQSAYLPTIALAAEYGFQGQTYDFSLDRDYFIASVVVRWNLWNGFGDKHKVKQAGLVRDRLEAQYEELRSQLLLQLRAAWDAAETAQLAIEAAGLRAERSRTAYGLVAARFAVGVAPAIELLDARTTMTRAELDEAIARYDFATTLVELERVAAYAPGATP